MPCFISGILPDRFILVSQDNKFSSEITSPMINPLEPILIGYLDSPNINYDLLKHAVVTMFTNQISQNLIDKFINRNLKEIAWMFIDDDKSSYQNINTKIDILNDNYRFDNLLDYLILNKDLTSKLDLDELIWRFNYDINYEYIKDILIKESKLLIEYGQFNSALKILELLGDYPLALNLLLVSTSPEDFDKLRIKFQAKESLNFTDSLLINHLFAFSKDSKNNNTNTSMINSPFGNNIDIGDIFGSNQLNMNLPNMNEDKMEHYHKIFDNFEGEHFIFGANQNEFRINSIENIKNIMENKKPRPKGMDSGIQKRVMNFGEHPFNLYSDDYNIINRQFQTIEICSLVLQKIENYYGIMSTLSKTEKTKMNRKNTFFNYNLSLKQLNKKEKDLKEEEDFDTDSKTRKSVIFIKPEELEEDEINMNLDEISEDLYLSAYYHMDKGNGDTIDDITNNQNNAKISCIYNNANPTQDKKAPKILKKEETTQEDDLKQIWSEVLEENDPLEYEDKWGRRSPPGHTIIFTKKLKTKITINNSSSLQHILDKFTIELWIKLKDSNDLNIFTKDALSFGVNKGQFTMSFHGQEIPAEVLKENYTLPLDKFIHVAFLYQKTFQNIIVLLNCVEVTKFNFLLSALEINTPIIFGNEKFDGEMTEIRIWNQRLPIEYIKENYKTPLPILAENKKKIKMNIDNANKKEKKRDSVFTFGDKETLNKAPTFNAGKKKRIDENNANNTNNTNNNNGFDFNNNNPEFMNNDFGNDFAQEEYPTMDLVSANSAAFTTNINVSGPINNPNLGNPNSSEFAFQENDFNFDK